MQADWNTPAGQALLTLAAAIERKGLKVSHPLIVFGSAPLQICVDAHFLSADVDVGINGSPDELKALVQELGLQKGNAEFYIEIVPSYVFRPGPNWRERAESISLHGVPFLIPTALDILLAKLRRLDEKDIRAFELVRERTGHPTEEELIEELKASYEVFYLQVGGKKSPLWENTEKLWPRFFDRNIDVRLEIIQPVLDELARGGADLDYMEQLRQQLGL